MPTVGFSVSLAEDCGHNEVWRAYVESQTAVAINSPAPDAQIVQIERR